jgi:predicted O-methyltransferase YrrM
MMPVKSERARSNLTAAGFSNWTLHTRDAQIVCDEWRESIDFLFLDADVDAYLRYWTSLCDHLAPGAIVIADNALTHAAEMATFAAQLETTEGFVCCVEPLDNGLLIAKNCV